MARSAIQFREGLSEVAATRIMAWKPNVRQHLISRYVPPHAIKEWSLGNGADAPVGVSYNTAWMPRQKLMHVHSA